MMKELNFREMFNSSMGHVEFSQAAMNHLILGKVLGGHSLINGSMSVGSPDHEMLSSTPLNEALVVLRDVIRNFKKAHHLDIVNTVIVHDGESDGNPNKHTKDGPESINTRDTKVTLRDKKEHITLPLDENDGEAMTKGLLRWIQMTTGAGVFGFFIINTEGNERLITHRYRDANKVRSEGAKSAKLYERFKREKFLESFSDGYTRFFFIPGAGDLISAHKVSWIMPPKKFTAKSQQKRENEERAKALLEGFTKSNKKKMVSKVLVNRFIDLIAVRTRVDKDPH